MTSLEGRIAIVTGAGGGIGRGHARLLGRLGVKVVVNDVGSGADGVVDEIVEEGGTAVANGDDVATFAGAEALVNQAIAEYGQLDILVNNAGILRDAISFKMTEADWDDCLRVHLKGHFGPSRFAALHWRERSKTGEVVRGRIINTASEAGLYGTLGQANYAAAKAGIASLSIVLARELARFGVTVNTIAPRAKTRMTESMLASWHDPQPGEFDPWDAENIAPVVAWLASDDAAHITGQTFVVFGNKVYLMKGWTMVSSVATDGRFDVADLVDRAPELFGQHDPFIPEMGFGE